MIASDYSITFPYGATDPPYGTAANPYHRGDDRYMPDGTPVVVNGVLIGYSGHSGWVTGSHLHIGRFINGKDTNPQGGGFTVNGAVVSQVGEDDTNGKFVRLADADGSSWVYLHLSDNSIVKTGNVLSQLPQYNGEEPQKQEEDMPNNGDVDNVYKLINGRSATDDEKKVYTTKSISAPDGLLYGKLFPDIQNLQSAIANGDKNAVTKLAEIKKLLA
jgi:hypothetical protein